MPPKKGGAAKKGNAKQKEDQEFEALLKQLNTTTAKKGKEEAAKHKNEPKHITAAERKAAVRNAQKEKEEAIAKQFESRVQQNKLQEMLRELMKNGGPGGMSPFLDSPKTAIESGNASAKAPSQLNAGYAAMQGWRRDMEDAHILFPDFVNAGGENWHLFCVMDGHGGSVVAQTVKTLLPANLIKAVGDKEPSQDAFASAFSEMDKQIRKKHGQACETCGTTCVTTMISDKKVYCASVGDSRAVLARKAGTPNDVVTLAYDHKPENEGERARIEKAGGHVENNRTNGNLAMSRALGDYVYKNVAGKPMDEQLVINVPDVISAERKEGDEFVVVACDGIFDVLSNEELVAVIRDEMAKLAAPGTRLTTAQLETVSGNLTKHCLAPATAQGPARGEGSDNMSIIIVQL